MFSTIKHKPKKINKLKLDPLRPSSETGGAVQKFNILIVDSQDATRSQLVSHFNGKGTAVEDCACLLEAKAILNQSCFDILFLGLPFPLEALKEFTQKLLNLKPELTCLLLVPSGDPLQGMQLLETTADAIISKPLGNLRIIDHFINKQIKQKNELITLNKKIKHLKNTCQQLEEKNTSLEMENQNKSQFIKNLSSNLFLPINQLVQFSDIGLTRIKRRETTLAGAYLSEIKLISQELSIYIDDLLEITKLSQGESEFVLEETDLSEILKTVINRFQTVADNRKIKLSLQTDIENPYVMADYSKLMKVITIVLRNAFRYVPEKGSIKLHATQEDQRSYLSISDNGPGIPLERRKGLFNMYDQNSVQNKLGVMGFGLSICKALMLGQGGDIWLNESQEDQGCCFFLSLPIASSILY